MDKQRQPSWTPPRGIRLISIPHRPEKPHAVQWRIAGKRKTKTFPTRELQIAFAKTLAGDARRDGLSAFRLNPDEAREWREFRAGIGEGVRLDAVLACWRRFGQATASPLVPTAVAAFLKAKEGEGVAEASLRHFKPIYSRFADAFQRHDTGTITRDQLEDYVATIEGANETRRTIYKRLRTLFRWLHETRQIAQNPFDGLKGPKYKATKIEILSVADGKKLFAENIDAPNARELLGRMACEAFAGVRHESAAHLSAKSFNFASKTITIDAETDKNRREQFIQNAPENLWQWLKWSQPETWTMEPIAYRNAKGLAFVRAKVTNPGNVLRHSAASYHLAAFGNAGSTAAMLTHSNLKMLWSNYAAKGGGEENGEAWLAIVPPTEEGAK